ncbi:MAG: Gfo/Idh/MocA family oxidoreductase [Devosia sp.]|jgi:predicted dehydrogenase|uniref:Gfo/Idh/MocA family protein n=1 Tax=unclassified Devosia TaxID=196773 RepID=UPI001A0775E5|nr:MULTISPECIES: Gfo/Idh/MocA family oxidoreductase [unclassified Devosia]MBF0679839.1 Gfo/Idh/MocA family oxidoreductase [Devosia sp.]WEJ34565.1 Gfo/Idh/MocA family oxidoreductase [Devosia sp. SD17-2]
MKRVLIIGSGGIGRRHLRGYTATGRAKLSVVEPHAERRAEAEEMFALEASYASLEEADLASFDLAVICAPAHMHVPLMQQCAAAGTAFMVEKPLAVTMDGVDAAIEAVKQSGVLARVGYIRRIAPELLAVREGIANGKIGDLRLAYVNSGQEFPKYRPDFQRTYYARPEMGGGAILDAASHTFDMLIWLMGRPVAVGAMHDRLVLQGTETEDTCLVNICFESGAMANVTINQFQKPNVSRTEFIGTAGNLTLNHSILSFADDDSGTDKETHDYMDGLVPTEAHQARFTIQANAMLDALEGKPCHLATLEEARLNLMVALGAKRSWTDRTIVSLGQ